MKPKDSDEVVITVMSDGTIVVTGPEPEASNLKAVLDQYFCMAQLYPTQERIARLHELLMGQPARLDRYQ